MNKRAKAREWKKQKRRQRLIFRLSVVGICILAVLGIAYIGWDMWSRTYVMTFNGNQYQPGSYGYFPYLRTTWQTQWNKPWSS